MSVVLTLLIFCLIVVVHEWGHFIVAKKSNVLVEEFAVGMGPKLFSKQAGETEYSLRALPLGGFCRMADETPDNSQRIGFNQANVWKRIAISVAGAVMNFVLAFVILTFMAMTTGVATNEIESVSENSPAYEAGILSGDRIVEVDGQKVRMKSDLSFAISSYDGKSDVSVKIKRNGEIIEKSLKPAYDEENGRFLLGVSVKALMPVLDVGVYEEIPEGYEKASFWDCVKDGYYNIFFLIKVTLSGFVQLVTRSIGVEQLSGPIGVTTIVGETYAESVQYGAMNVIVSLLYLAALLSANLGVINLLPLPAIDGGRIVFYVIEVIRGKKISPEKEGFVHFIGFLLLILFGVFIAYNDLIKLFGN